MERLERELPLQIRAMFLKVIFETSELIVDGHTIKLVKPSNGSLESVLMKLEVLPDISVVLCKDWVTHILGPVLTLLRSLWRSSRDNRST